MHWWIEIANARCGGLDQHQDTEREKVHKQRPLIREINMGGWGVGGEINAVNINRLPESGISPITVLLNSPPVGCLRH